LISRKSGVGRSAEGPGEWGTREIKTKRYKTKKGRKMAESPFDDLKVEEPTDEYIKALDLLLSKAFPPEILVEARTRKDTCPKFEPEKSEIFLCRLTDFEHYYYGILHNIGHVCGEKEAYLPKGAVEAIGEAMGALRNLFWALTKLNHRETWANSLGIRGEEDRELYALDEEKERRESPNVKMITSLKQLKRILEGIKGDDDKGE
jgi:hypothetical protein